jgi:acyl-CoA thioester hydrolase
LVRKETVAVCTYVGVIYPSQIDHMGHLNVAHYAAMFDQATWVFLAKFGLNRRYTENGQRGMAAVSQNVSYYKEVFAGDVVNIQSVLLEVHDKTIRFLHTMRCNDDDAVVATSEIVGAHLDRVHHRACSLPEEIRERLRKALAADSPTAGR